MRKIVTAAFVTLDGVMQAPGGPEEDPTGGFEYGGWVAPLWDDTLGDVMGELFAEPYDLLLGRRTYDIFAAYWPFVELDPEASRFDALNAQIAEQFNSITKYVATHRPESLRWQNSQGLGTDVVARLRELKQDDGPRLLTQGSAELVHLLLKNDLVDELRLLVFPLILGNGKRLFDTGSRPTTLELKESTTSPNGTVLAHYERVGGVATAPISTVEPTAAELERRKNIG